MGTKDTEDIYLDERLVNLMIGKSQDIQKYRRLKIGKEPSICELEEILYLQDIMCRRPCYLSEKDIIRLEQKLISISNGY